MRRWCRLEQVGIPADHRLKLGDDLSAIVVDLPRILGLSRTALVRTAKGYNPVLFATFAGAAGIAFGLAAASRTLGCWLDQFFPLGDEPHGQVMLTFFAISALDRRRSRAADPPCTFPPLARGEGCRLGRSSGSESGDLWSAGVGFAPTASGV